MLGLLVDWGYRADGIPVKLFGAVDGAARRSGDAGRQDRLPHPAHHDPAPAGRDVPRDVARSDRPRIGRPGRAPARDPVDRRRARHHRRRGAGPVVQLQADLAGDAGGGRRPRAPRDPDAGRHRGSRGRRRSSPDRASRSAAGSASGCCSSRPGWPATCRSACSSHWRSSRATSGIAPRPTAPPRRAGTCAASRRTWLVAGGARPGSAAAATDPRALERLVRLAYRHAARYYLEVVRTPGLRPCDVDERMDDRDPRPGRRRVHARTRRRSSSGCTSGRSSSPRSCSRHASAVPSRRWRPSTTRALQDWFVRTRGAVGVRIVGLREARRELQAALRTGTSVGLVGDRDLTGGGVLTELFGAPAQLPARARHARRGERRALVRDGRSADRHRPLQGPARTRRRHPPTAAVASASPRRWPASRGRSSAIVEDAPEQWWAVFFPIWPDLEAEAAAAAGAPVAPEAPSPEARTT